MKNIFKILLFVTIVGLLIYLQREFFPKIEVENSVITSVIYKDTIIYKDTVIYIPKPYKVEVPSEIIYIPEDCDSLKALYEKLYKNYKSTVYYSEMFEVDTIGTAVVDVTLSENKIDSIKFKSSYNLYEKTITNTVFVKSNGAYIYSETDFNSINLGLVYNRNKFIYKGTYNINQHTISLGIGYKIW